jgi:hypothetical protein
MPQICLDVQFCERPFSGMALAAFTTSAYFRRRKTISQRTIGGRSDRRIQAVAVAPNVSQAQGGSMDGLVKIAIIMAAVTATLAAQATGLATCNSGPESGWQSEEALKQKLTAQGWSIRRIKVDGGCYEVYAVNDKGQRVETYFHPVTFEHVLTTTR